MKIRFEGSAAELEAFFAALRGSGMFSHEAPAPVGATIPLEASDQAASETVAEPVVDPFSVPLEAETAVARIEIPRMSDTSMRGRVFTHITLHPNQTAGQISQQLGVDQEQVRGAMKFLTRVGLVDRVRKDGNLILPHSYFPTGAELVPTEPSPTGESRSQILRGLIVAELQRQPGQTSRQLTNTLSGEYNSVSSMTTKMTRKGELLVSGSGGLRDPYCYTLA